MVVTSLTKMILPDQILETGIALKDEYFDLSGLSLYCKLGVSTLRNHIRKDGLPCFKLGGKILVRRGEFDKWVSGYRLNKNQEISRVVDEAISSLKSGKSA